MKGLLVISLRIFLNPQFCGSKQKWQKDVKEDRQDVQADVYSSLVTLKRKSNATKPNGVHQNQV